MARKTKKVKNGYLSIGQAVSSLRGTYPDLSISKVRYLEDQGLLKPRRTKGGYRLFSQADIQKLAEIMRLQQEKFLPLAVIKEQLQDWEFNQVTGAETDRQAADPAGTTVDITLDELLKKTGLKADTAKTLKNFGLLQADGVEAQDLTVEEVEILKLFSKLKKFGIEARHLRMYEHLAQKETLLFQQILTPQIKHKSQKLRQKSLGDLRELVALTELMRSTILRKSLREADLL